MSTDTDADGLTSFKELDIPGLPDIKNSYYEPEDINNLQFDNYFSVMSHNIRSLNPTTFDEIQLFFNDISKKKFTVVAVQEIRQINQIYEPAAYHKLISKTRKKKKTRGGGVGFWVDSNYKFEILEDLSIIIEDQIESLFIKIFLPNKNPKNESKNNYIIVGNFYRAPDYDFDLFYDKFSEIVETLQSTPYKGHDHFLVGDFNINLIEQHKREPAEYLNLLAQNKYLPKILLPTRVQNQSATLIDHIFTNTKQTGSSGIR